MVIEARRMPEKDWRALCAQSRNFADALGRELSQSPFTYFKGDVVIDGVRGSASTRSGRAFFKGTDMNATFIPTTRGTRTTITVALCFMAAFLVVSGAPVRADLLVHLTFDDEKEPGLDSSGNDLHGELDGAQWVDDAEREGVLEFVSGNDGFVRVRLAEELPSDDFTFAFWVYRDSLKAGGGNDGLFQVQLGGDTPTSTPADKVIGAWVAGSGGVWGRLHQQDRTRLNLDANTFFMESDKWMHFAYRGDGETFEVVVDGEAGVGPSLSYDGTSDRHDTFFIGKQGTESWGGRIDDFRVYTRALADEEIVLVMSGEVAPPPKPLFLRGDADASGSLQITDAVGALNFLFLGTFQPTCMDALDWDDNGRVEIADPIGNLNHQFSGGAPAPAPGSQNCGADPTEDDQGCDVFAACP